MIKIPKLPSAAAIGIATTVAGHTAPQSSSCTAIGAFASEPGTEGTSQLSVTAQVEVTDEIRPRVTVSNPTDMTKTYQLKVYLLQGDTVHASVERTVTVGASSSQLVSDISFGTQPQGAYAVRSELWLNDRAIDTQGPLDVRVIDPQKQKAINEAGL